MRIIVAGDKSRYQFFRDIINVDVSQMREEFYTENLGRRTVYLTSDKNQVNNDVVLFSDKVPLNTVLCFPEEFLDVPTICEMEDRVVLFDEFPYATEKKLERAQKLSDFGVADQLQVILIINNRIGLQSDLSTVEMALEEAEKLYQKSNISVYCWRREIATIFCREYLTNFCRRTPEPVEINKKSANNPALID